jgi:hypothetical protein
LDLKRSNYLLNVLCRTEAEAVVADVTVDATTVVGTDADLQAAVIVTDTAVTVVQAAEEAAVTEEEETKLFFHYPLLR